MICLIMARLPIGRKALVKTLVKIMEDPSASIDQKLRACEIYNNSFQKPNKKIGKKNKKVSLLG